MSLLHKAFAFSFSALVAVGLYDGWRRHRRSPNEQPEQDADPSRVQVTREPLGGGYEVVRFRGRFDEVMDSLHGRKPAQPPALPPDLDLSNLPKYYGGCPHCGSSSLHGQSMWFYHELERTRGHYDNTTTYLTRCKSCSGLMKATIDHDD
ncbi:MAG: hypothetical protein AB7S38_36935 [Vulcanimicrobiota bacterium]